MEFDEDPGRIRAERLSQRWRIEKRMTDSEGGDNRSHATRLLERFSEREPAVFGGPRHTNDLSFD